MIARLLALRGALFTIALVGAAIGVAQVGDELARAIMREPATFTISALGDEVPRLAPISVTFATAPEEREPAKLLQLEPASAGSYAWLSARTLLFQPDFPGLLRGGTYTLKVPARPEAGLPSDITKKFTIAGQLVVQQVIPGDGDADVPVNAQLFVQFSRSVAPLTTLAAQPTDTVVVFDPPLQGKGEWLNTSIYRFTPSELRPATTYRVKIAKGLTSAADGVLKDDFVSAFTTIQPAVESIQPDANWIFCGPWQEVNITFNQPMDPGAANGLSVRLLEGDIPVTGTVKWNDARTMLIWNPAQRLAPATKYRIVLERGLQGAHGGVTANTRDATFTTIPLPQVARTFPTDGESGAQRFGVNVQFATPMDPATLDGKLSISGFSAEDLEGRVSTSEQYVGANVTLQPSTTYTATLAPGATDRYGQVMGGHRWSFTTGALPSSVSLAIPGYSAAATYSSSVDPIVYFQATNMPAVKFSLYPLTPDEGRRYLHDPSPMYHKDWAPLQAAIRSWTEQIDGAKNDTVLSTTSIGGGKPLAKGYYFLRTDGEYQSKLAFAVVDTVLVTKVAQRELLAWAIDHDTGKPLAGVTLRATGAITPSERVTDASGLASFDVAPVTLGSAGGDRSYVLWIDGAGRSAYTTTRWQNGISPYQFGIGGEYYLREWVGHLYTDRPIYRPGERVEFKGIVRADDDARYSLPPTNVPFDLVIGNPRGAEALRQTVTLNEFGSFAGSFQIPSDTPLGDYNVSLQLQVAGADAKGKANTHWIAGNSFLVAEFRTPEFQVSVTTPRGSYVNGDTIDATVAATFFFGGGLEGAPVQWSVLGDPSYALRVPDHERYSFTDYDYFRQNVLREAQRAKGTAKTDASGVATFSVPATLQAGEGAQRFTLSGAVTDENGQGAASSASVTVHPAAYYAGVHPRFYVAREGTSTLIDLVSVDTEGAIVGGRAVALKVYQREWITSKVQIPGGGRRYTSEPKDTLIATLPVRTERDGTAVVTYKPTRAGTLRLVAEITDDRGRVARSATYLWVSGRGFASWQVTNDDTIKLVADKERYAVGDTADVLVPAPFAGATALVTIERGGIITREVRTLATNSERIAVPIVDRSVPNVYVSVVLYRAPTATDPIPRFKVGYVELPVSTDTRQLTVKIEPDRKQAKPGDTVRYAIRVTDSKGHGVKSEVSVAVVDKAVLSLQDERGPDGLKAFWFQRGLGVNTSSSMTVSVDRWNDAVVEAARVGKGGSGAGGGQAAQQARRDFRNTAYWSAQLVTRDDGTATVDVTLPDNLTTWRMQARAMSGDSMVGEGLHELVSAQPLMIRSALPRFLRVGDSADLRVLVRNSTASPLTASVRLAADGLSVGSVATQATLVGPNESVILTWPSKAVSEGTAKLSFTATAGDLADSLEVSLPVYMDMTPETMATGGVVTKDGALEAIYLPPFADTTHGSLNVQVRSALVGTMVDELWHLRPYTYEGAEHVASRLIAELGVRRAQQSAGFASADLSGSIDSDLAGLIGRQRADGGWPWCDDPMCQTDPNVTSFVLFALAEAMRDGLSVDGGVIDRASRYVTAQLNRPQDVALPDTLYASSKAMWLASVSSAGGGDASIAPARALFEQDRAKLTNWARAFLLLALTEAGTPLDDAMVRALFNDLATSTIPSANGNHWEDTGRGGFFTNTAATGLGTLALARLQPQHLLLQQTVRWLVLARAADGWHTSIDRALGILALTTYAVGTGELGGDYTYKVLIDDKDVLAGLVRKGALSAEAKQVPLSTFTPGKSSLLAVTRDYDRPGRLYYTLDLRYVTPAKEIEALNRGFAVSHEYTALDDPTKPLASAKVGETIRVKVTVIAPADRKYVVVEDLLPAGLEAVDVRLKNVDPALREKLESERAAADQNKYGGYYAPWFRWYYSPWQQAELRDDRAVLKTERLPKGVYEYVYYARATTPGDFFVAPAHAEETYFPEVFGRSDSARFNVKP